MASAFNLTAQINIAGPANIKPVVGKIQKQLKGIKATVDIKLDKRVASQLRSINKNMTALNASLKAVNRTAKGTSRGLNAMASASVSNKIGRTAQSINSLSRAAKNSGNTLQNTNKQLQKSGNLMQAFGKHVSLAAKKFAAFSLVTGIIYRVSNAIDVAVSEFVEFDRQLTRVSQVTGTSMQGLRGLDNTIRGLATGLGVSSQALIKVSTTLAQAGLTAEQTRQALSALAKTSLAPTFGDLNDTVEGSIAIMRQFSISTKELEGALGSINAVASQFAVESQDIITAVKRAGGVFAAASKGVAEGTEALNQFMAIFTSIRATTREGAETIATGLRTIFTRIQRGDTIEKLQAIGVNLTDLEGKFVGPYEAVRRLSIALGGLDPRSVKFSAIAEELGGFRQIGKVIPMLQQFNVAQAAYFTAQKGAGSLTKDATIAQQALAVQIQKTREQFISFVASLSNNQGLKEMATLALKAASAILKIAEAIGPAMPALSIMLGGKLARGGLRMMTGKKFAAGGMVPGSGNRDTVPAMLTPGEFVIRKKAVGAIGVDNLHQMNQYAAGGEVQRFTNGKHAKKKKRRPRRSKRFFKQSIAGIENESLNYGDVSDSTDISATAKGSIQGIMFERMLRRRMGRTDATDSKPDFKNLSDAEKITLGLLDANGNPAKRFKHAEAKLQRSAYGKKYTQNTAIVHAFAKGGSVGEDTVPALLTPGEFVINKKAASRIGASKLHNLNQADRITGYNKGGFVGFSKGGKAKKDAAIISQATTMNPAAMAKMEKALQKFGATTEETRAAMLGYAKSLLAGDSEQEATTRATAALNSHMQKTQKGKKVVGPQGPNVGSGAGSGATPGTRMRALGEAGIEKKFGAGSKGSEAALKVFRHEIAAGASATQAYASALHAGKQNAVTFSQKLAAAGTGTAKFTAKITGMNAVATSFKNVFKGPTAAVKRFGAALGKTKVGKATGKLLRSQGAGAMMARQMAGAGLVAAGGMGVTALSNAYKGPGGKETDMSRSIAGAGQGALSGGAMGAQIGMMFGPLGGAIGGAVGALAGFTMGLINAAKENAKAAAQEKKNRQQSFAEGSDKSLKIFSDTSKGTGDRAAARRTFLARGVSNMDAQRNTAAALKATGSSDAETAAAFGKAASQSVQFLTTEATRTGKSLSEIEASMSPREFAALKQSILMADEAYVKTLDAQGNETAASKAAAEKAMENVKEMTKTNAELAKQRRAIAAMAKVSASYVIAARNLNGAIQAAEASFNHASQEMATIKDPTAAVSYRNRNLEVANNPASTGAAQSRAYSGMAAGLGGPGQAMANMAAMPKNLEETTQRTISANIGADQATFEKAVKDNVKAQLMASGASDADAEQAASSFAANLASREDRGNINVQQEIASDKGLSAMMDGANASAEALKNYSKSVGEAFDQLAANARTLAADQQALRDSEANAIGERMANEDRMNAILGKGQGLQDKLNRINQKSAAQRNARLGQNVSSNPVQAAQQLRGMIDTNQAAAAKGRQNRMLGGDTGTAIQGEQDIARFAQAAKTAEEELRKLPGQLQGSIDAVLSEMESVMAHRSAQIDAGAGLMEKALSGTPSDMLKMSKTMNLASAAAQGFAPTIQQSEAAQKAYMQTIRGGGSQRQAQSAAQQAYAQESGDSLNMLKEMMPLLTAAGPEGKAEANKMMANAYEAQFAARGIDINQTPFGKIIEMMRQDPGEDPQIAALTQQLEKLEEQKAMTQGVIDALDETRMAKAYEMGNQIVVTKLEEIRAGFAANNAGTSGLGTPTPGAGGSGGALGSGTPAGPPISSSASSGTGSAMGSMAASGGRGYGSLASSRGSLPSGRSTTGGSPSTTAQNQGNGVNTNGLAQFTDKLNNLFTQLANVSIPSEINLTGAFDVSVKLNGAEVLAKIEPKVKEMILEHTGQEINQFAADNFGGEGKSKKVPLGKSADQPTMA